MRMLQLLHDLDLPVNLLQIAGIQLSFIDYLDGHLGENEERTNEDCIL